MVSLSSDRSIIFILGAGFNIDAASEAGNPNVFSGPIKYPLVKDLSDKCFGINSLPSGKSIEDLFQDSINKRNIEPRQKLYDTLMEADHYITPHLEMGGAYPNNVYMRFLNDFPISSLITFNYDSLPEILLLSKKLWRPDDGYGVPVRAGTARFSTSVASFPPNSQRIILHLHGTLCVYADEYYTEYIKDPNYDNFGTIHEREKPEFIFDPDLIGDSFIPFDRIPPTGQYKQIEERVIAPVPNKAQGFNDTFIKEVYRKAIDLIKNSDTIVVIGYRFNSHDLASYSPLLQVCKDKIVLVVSPDSQSVVKKLRNNYSNIRWRWENMSFKEWVNNKYPGIL